MQFTRQVVAFGPRWPGSAGYRKLQKFLRQPMTAKVTLSPDKLQHVAEARVSSGEQHIEAREESEDMYASIDRMVDKLERIIRGTKGAKEAKARRSGATLRTAAKAQASAEAAEEPKPEPKRPRAAAAARPAKTTKKVAKVAKTATKAPAARTTTRKAAKR